MIGLRRVVTYQSPAGATMDICAECAERLTAAHAWPKDGRGEEYCSVYRGEHSGTCGMHPLSDVPCETIGDLE